MLKINEICNNSLFKQFFFYFFFVFFSINTTTSINLHISFNFSGYMKNKIFVKSSCDFQKTEIIF